MPNPARKELQKTSSPRVLWVVALLLLGSGGLWLHWGAWEFDFVNYDDPDYVSANEMVAQGLNATTVRWAFTTQHAANWHPLTWLSHLADVSLFGLDAGAQHRTNLFLHGLNALLLSMALVTATAQRGRSFVVAALYLLHPLAVESTLWISERKDLLSATFALASLWAYASAHVHKRPRRRRLAWALFALGLLAKPMLVSWPCVLLLFDRWPLRRTDSWRALWREKWAWFAVALVVAALTAAAQRSGGSVSSVELIPFAARLANAVVAYARYVGKYFWPASLAVSYPHPALVPSWGAWSAMQILSSALLLALLAALAIWKRRGPLGIGIAWWAGMLVPVIGLVQVGSQSLADRYMLLPSIGLALALVFSLPVGSGRRGGASAAVAFAVLCLLGWRAHAQGRVWRNSQSLFEHAVATTRDNWLGWNNLGNARRSAGEPATALSAYEACLRIQPNYASAHYNHANALVDLRRLAEAEAGYRSALRLDPRHAGARVNLARVCLATQRPEEAVTLLTEALELTPDDLAVRLNLAQALHGLGRGSEAQTVLDGAAAGQWAAAGPGVRERLLALRQRLREEAGEMP